MKFFLVLILMLLSLLFGCSGINQKDIAEKKLILMSGNDHVEIIETCHWIIDNDMKDSSIVIALLTHVLDGRESTTFSNYGQNTYESRIKALEKITGAKSEYEVTYKEDALVVDFYLDWAINKNLLKSKNDLELIHPYIKEIYSSEEEIKSILNYDKVDWLKNYKWPEPSRKGVFHGEK